MASLLSDDAKEDVTFVTWFVDLPVICKYPAFKGRKDNPWFSGKISYIDEGSQTCSVVFADGDVANGVKFNELFASNRENGEIPESVGKDQHRFNDIESLLRSYNHQFELKQVKPKLKCYYYDPKTMHRIIFEEGLAREQTLDLDDNLWKDKHSFIQTVHKIFNPDSNDKIVVLHADYLNDPNQPLTNVLNGKEGRWYGIWGKKLMVDSEEELTELLKNETDGWGGNEKGFWSMDDDIKLQELQSEQSLGSNFSIVTEAIFRTLDKAGNQFLKGDDLDRSLVLLGLDKSDDRVTIRYAKNGSMELSGFQELCTLQRNAGVFDILAAVCSLQCDGDGIALFDWEIGELNESFRYIDSDNSGTVNGPEEMGKLLYYAGIGKEGTMVNRYMSMAEVVLEHFDQDGDGVLSIEEVLGLLRAVKGAAMILYLELFHTSKLDLINLRMNDAIEKTLELEKSYKERDVPGYALFPHLLAR